MTIIKCILILWLPSYVHLTNSWRWISRSTANNHFRISRLLCWRFWTIHNSMSRSWFTRYVRSQEQLSLDWHGWLLWMWLESHCYSRRTGMLHSRWHPSNGIWKGYVEYIQSHSYTSIYSTNDDILQDGMKDAVSIHSFCTDPLELCFSCIGSHVHTLTISHRDILHRERMHQTHYRWWIWYVKYAPFCHCFLFIGWFTGLFSDRCLWTPVRV